MSQDNFFQRKYEMNQRPNDEMTEPCYFFFEKVFRLNSLWHFIISMVDNSQKLDSLGRKLKELEQKINKGELNEKTKDSDLKEFLSGQFRWIDEYHFNESTLSELLFSKNVDSFSIYLDDILRTIFRAENRLLISKEKLSVEDVLSCNSIDAVVEKIISQKAHDFSYKSLEDKLKFLIDEIGLKFQIDSQHLKDLKFLVEVRNILVHNGGKVNEIFLYKTKNNNYSLNETIRLDTGIASDATLCFAEAVRLIDVAVIQKFGNKLFIQSGDDFVEKMESLVKSESGKFTTEVLSLIENNSTEL